MITTADLEIQQYPAQVEPFARITAQSQSELELLVVETINALAAKGIAAGDMAPLFQLKDAVRDLPETVAADRREGAGIASDALLARAAVIIDILIQGGHGHDKAAQLMSRQLVASGVTLPDTGGDARGWKRLLQWRTRLVQGGQSREATDAYLRFKTEIVDIPADERLSHALDARLWDRRRA